MAENPQPLTGTTITAIQKNAATINSVANAISKATGISITPLGIASPIAREMKGPDRLSPDIRSIQGCDRFQPMGDVAGPASAIRGGSRHP